MSVLPNTGSDRLHQARYLLEEHHLISLQAKEGVFLEVGLGLLVGGRAGHDVPGYAAPASEPAMSQLKGPEGLLVLRILLQTALRLLSDACRGETAMIKGLEFKSMPPCCQLHRCKHSQLMCTGQILNTGLWLGGCQTWQG